MAVSKKAIKNNNYKLRGSLRKCGFDRWRYIFNGINSVSGEERMFFIELLSVNPAVSPDAVVSLSSAPASEPRIDAADLQNALAGNISVDGRKGAQPAERQPSFASVRAGAFGAKARQILKVFPNSEFVSSKKRFEIKVGGCVFSDKELNGVLAGTRPQKGYGARADASSSGEASHMEWSLKYERKADAPAVGDKSGGNWLVSGITAEFSGMVRLDGVEYAVSPAHSFGATDKAWGSAMPLPFIHISSCRLTSIFTGNVMPESGFSLEGDYDGKVAALAKFDGEIFSFGKKLKIRKYASRWSCTRSPDAGGAEELHWSVSLNCKKYILDVDVFCPVSEMLVKDYELPAAGAGIVKVLCGGSGTGEIRLYRQIKKSLELIQHAKILEACCEFGQSDEENED